MPAQANRPGLWQRLIQHGQRNRLSLTEGNQARLLPTGSRILEATRSLIDGAKSRIHFEIYTWGHDATGRELLERLQEAQARGVVVRGVVDFAGSWEALKMIKASNLDIRFFHPIGFGLPWRLWHRRNHRKLLIADGSQVVVGSANWADVYSCEAGPRCFRDLGVELRGPVVEGLEADFQSSWRRAGGKPLALAPPTQVAPPEGSWHTGIAVQIVSTLNGGGRTLRRHLLLILGQLQRRAIIASAYFIPGPRLLKALLRASRRGVKLEFIVPGVSDHRFVQSASRATFGRLLRAGAEIWERRERMFHMKAAVLDSDLLIIGTANLDSRSFRHNLELNLVLRSAPLALEATRVLDEERAMSRSITLAAWQSTALWRRGLQRLAYLFWWWL